MANFKSVLSKIGQVILTAGGIAGEVMGIPFLGSLLGSSKAGGTVTLALGDLSKVASIVSVIETGFAALSPTEKTGSAKLAAAVPMVKQILLDWAQSNLPGHSSLKVDPQVFSAHVSNFTSAFVDILNDFGD